MNAAEDALQARITRLEELAAHQAQTIDELSTELANQWATVDQLQKKLERLIDRFMALEEASLQAPEITKPPHY